MKKDSRRRRIAIRNQVPKKSRWLRTKQKFKVGHLYFAGPFTHSRSHGDSQREKIFIDEV